MIQINVRIKVIIIIVSKPDFRVNWGEAQVTGREGQHGLTRVNVWIKVVIIIILKSDSKVNPRQGSGHGSEGSTQLAQNFKLFTF